MRSIHESHSGCQPSYLPQALLPPFPRVPSAIAFASPPPFPSPSPSPFTRPYPPRPRHHSPPTSTSATNPLRFPRLSPPRCSIPLDENPSDIHRRVSSELIIKCIVVSTPTSQRTPSFHPHRLTRSLSFSVPPPPPPPRRHTPATRHGSSRIFGWRSCDSRV